MTYLTTKQIRKKVKALQPGIKFPLYRDREYYIFPHADLPQLIEDHKAEFLADLPQEERPQEEILIAGFIPATRPRVDEDEDCDDWADSFQCYVRRHYRRIPGINKAAAVGKVIGLKFNDIETNHTKNIVVTDTGVYFVDARQQEINVPDKDRDKSWSIIF
jgi:hypothetical protein